MLEQEDDFKVHFNSDVIFFLCLFSSNFIVFPDPIHLVIKIIYFFLFFIIYIIWKSLSLQ